MEIEQPTKCLELLQNLNVIVRLWLVLMYALVLPSQYVRANSYLFRYRKPSSTFWEELFTRLGVNVSVNLEFS